MLTLRNDDVCSDTPLEELSTFCKICDRYGVSIIHSVIAMGGWRQERLRGLKSWGEMPNWQIVSLSGNAKFKENHEIVDFLLGRGDQIAVHGLWHVHRPTIDDVFFAKTMLEDIGLCPTYFVPPFHEGDYGTSFADLSVMCQVPHLEDYLTQGVPNSDILFVHSWRFNDSPHSWKNLDSCLARLCK